MKSLFYKYDLNVDHAYIMRIKGNRQSERYAIRCAQSCERVGQPYIMWDAFDGTHEGVEIQFPEHAKNESIYKILKLSDHYITKAEVACTLTHLSVWLECAKIGKPVVILEHDAVMLRRFERMDYLNSIVYLGGEEWVKKGWEITPVPPLGSDGINYRFICRAHAYVIDPAMAKNLLAYVLQHGIRGAPDYMMRFDLFNITHQGLYAYDDYFQRTDTTIKNRISYDRPRNEHLER